MKSKFVLAGVMTALMFALVACGGKRDSGIPTANGGTGTAAPKATASLSDAQKKEQGHKFAQCMRDHGVQMDDPDPDHPGMISGGPGADDGKTKAALDACRQYMPNGGEQVKPNPEQLAQARKLAQCMRDHGVANFPDPDPDGGGLIGKDSGINPNDPTFKAADEACKDLRPAGLSGGPGQ